MVPWGNPSQSEIITLFFSKNHCKKKNHCYIIQYVAITCSIYLYMCVCVCVYIHSFFWTVLGLSCSMWDLVPSPGMKPRPPALGAWSRSHWTTRELHFIFRWQNVSVITVSLDFEKPKTSLSILVFKYWDEYPWMCGRPCSQRIAPEPAATQSSVLPFIFFPFFKSWG